MSQQRQQRLRAVKLEKGADAAQGHGRGRHLAGLRVAFRLAE